MADITKSPRIDEKRLRGNAYLQSLLTEGVRAGVLTEEDAENAQMGCIQLLAEQIELENRGYSSSVPEETAQRMMASIAYTVSLGLKTYPDADTAAEALKGTRINAIYAQGGARIAKLLRETHALYKQAKETRLDVPNAFYNAVLDSSLKAFFRRYDPEFAANESNFLPEYPLFFPVQDPIGVEFVHAYIHRLCWENRFCGQFPAEELQELFSRCVDSLPNASVNLFRCVLHAAMGNALLKGDLHTLRLSEQDVRDLFALLQNRVPEGVKQQVSDLLPLPADAKEDFRQYVADCLHAAIETLCSVRAQGLPRFRMLFLAPVRKPETAKTVFRTESRMPDGQYRDLLEQLSQAKTESERVRLVRDEVASLGDLADLLNDTAWSNAEISALFETLDDLSIAVLEKRAAQEAEQDPHASAATYLPRLRAWIASLPALRQRTINQLISEIEIEPF